jgi:ATP-binding cassette subfamily C protein LapB
MTEILRRLGRRPLIAAELAFGSLLINVLALASPLFVMQVLNRYIGQGVDATLATLTGGVLIAISFEYVLRRARLKLARGVSTGPDAAAAASGFKALVTARTGALGAVAADSRKELAGATAAVETAYGANTVTALLDAPFALLFVGAVALIEPRIAAVVLLCIAAVVAAGAVYQRRARTLVQAVQDAAGTGGALLGTATREPDTVRSFNAQTALAEKWRAHTAHAQALRRDLTATQGLLQTVTQSGAAVMSVAVIGLGAVLVVAGDMTVGAMIGANILAARALQPIAKVAQLGEQFAKAREALGLLETLAALEREALEGATPAACKGAVAFRDAAFAFDGSATPLFERLDLSVEPGGVLVVTGANGTGKSTVARLLMGLVTPTRGQVLIDGQDLNQLSLTWWRRQVLYLPQEPALIDGTIAENIRVNRPDADDDAVNNAVDRADLRTFIDTSPQGLQTPVVDNGWRLSEGIRRRIALARALLADAAVALIDEPTEGLDRAGRLAVRRAMADMAGRGATIIVMSHDPDIVKGPHQVLDLNAKPTPTVAARGMPEPKQIESAETRLLEHSPAAEPEDIGHD